MTDEEIINNDEQVIEEEKPTRPELRNKDLSEKVIQTAKERDEATAKATALEKELDFHKGFSKVASKFQNASEYEDKIKEKVLSGADVEEATVAILYKAGKLEMNTPVQRESPMGGSATTAMRSQGEKSIDEMSTAEKREALLQIEHDSPGSLTQSLRKLNL